MKIETLAVHAGRAVEAETGAVTPSIVLSTTFERAEDGAYPGGYIYTRTANPNRLALEQALALLEGGAAAFAFASGQAATAAVFQTLKTNDHVILPDDLYHGTRSLAKDLMSRWGIYSSFVDMTDHQAIKQALQPETKLIWVETPSNPLLKIVDVHHVAELAHDAGMLCVVDNTWATPIWQNPLALGADVVMHSTTKYLGGHSDVLGGALIVRDDNALVDQMRTIQNLSGGVPSPFDCWLLLRSLPTLPVRVHQQTSNAEKIAYFLSRHPHVETVHYPGLSSHKGYEIATSQMRGFGGMLSFQVRGGQSDAMTVVARLKIFIRATSLGGVESLIEHRASIEGKETRTPVNLLRASIGLEHLDDLVSDLEQALERI